MDLIFVDEMAVGFSLCYNSNCAYAIALTVQLQ